MHTPNAMNIFLNIQHQQQTHTVGCITSDIIRHFTLWHCLSKITSLSDEADSLGTRTSLRIVSVKATCKESYVKVEESKWTGTCRFYTSTCANTYCTHNAHTSVTTITTLTTHI